MLDGNCDTLPKFVIRNQRKYPDKLAMRRKTMGIWNRVTWDDFGEQMRLIAAGLLAMDVKDESCLAIIGDNEPELYWIEAAIQATGHAATCIYPDLAFDEVLHNLQDCLAKVIFVEDQEQCDKLLRIADEVGLKKIIYWDDRGMEDYDDPRVMSLDALRQIGADYLGKHPDSVDKVVANGNADDLAVVIYTSGTTGAPKGVLCSHRYLLDIADRWRKVLGVRPGSNYVSYISPAWATEQYLGLALGVSLPMVVNFPEEPETVTSDMREIGPEFLFFSPRQWEAVVSTTEARILDAARPVRAIYRWSMAALASEYGKTGLRASVRRGLANLLVGRALRDRLGFTNLKTAVNSGSTLSAEVFSFFHALGIDLRNVYGFTEIGIVTATTKDDPNDSVGSVLISEHGTEPLCVRVEDDEIQVRGGAIFDGYLNRTDETAGRFTHDGWVKSGDAGRFDEDGRLIYLDRLDDLRKLGSGETIAPQYIETRIRLSPYIRDIIVVGEGRDALAAMVDIDMEMVGLWSEERRIAFTSQVDLSQHPKVMILIRDELLACNLMLTENNRISKFVNLFKPFDADEGELTRSGKLRRAVVENKYADLIDAVYGDEKSFQAAVEMKLQDGRKRQLKSLMNVGILS